MPPIEACPSAPPFKKIPESPHQAIGQKNSARFGPISLFLYNTFHKKYRKAEYVQRRVCFVNKESSLHENVACYHFWLNINCGVAVTVRSHQKKYQVTL